MYARLTAASFSISTGSDRMDCPFLTRSSNSTHIHPDFLPAVSGIFFCFCGILINKTYRLDYFSLFKYDEGVNANTQVQELLT